MFVRVCVCICAYARISYSFTGKVFIYSAGPTLPKIKIGGGEAALNVLYCNSMGAGTGQSVWRLATGWAVRGSNHGGEEIFRTRPDRPWGPLSLPYNWYRVFRGGKAAEAWR
jgi:hypothetical protein